MTDLTEQWKKGELPSGYYYVKNKFGNIFPSDYLEDYDYISDTVIKDFFKEVSEIKEVIEPVPSYEELKAKDAENTQLKKLLKECRKWIGVERDFAVPNEKIILQQLLTKIDEVLDDRH